MMQSVGHVIISAGTPTQVEMLREYEAMSLGLKKKNFQRGIFPSGQENVTASGSQNLMQLKEENAATYSVLGTGSCYMKCSIVHSTGQNNVKHITSCAPEDHWCINYIFKTLRLFLSHW